jgi:hypothetical protein
VTLTRFSRWTLGALLAVVTLFAAAAVGLWLLFSEPWYDTALLAQMRPGVDPAVWRDDTTRLTDFFPHGMTLESATALLRRNGFFCSEPNSGEGDAVRFDCVRKKSDLVCETAYMIRLSVVGSTVTDVKPSSYAACL